MPNLLGHSDNYIPANPLVTPAHIVPEWYFLPFYAILRSIPDKLFGVLAMILSIVTLALVPFLIKPEIRSMQFRPMSKILFWIFVVDCVLLGWLGGKPIEYPYLEISQFATIFYFLYFFAFYPLVIFFERLFWTNNVYIQNIRDYYRNM